MGNAGEGGKDKEDNDKRGAHEHVRTRVYVRLRGCVREIAGKNAERKGKEREGKVRNGKKREEGKGREGKEGKGREVR